MAELPTNDFLDEAFITEISEAQAPLRAYILKLVGYHHATQDILQEANIILWKKRMTWDPDTVFLKWAYRVAYFQTKAHFRDLSREKQRLTFSDSLLELLAQDEPQFKSEAKLHDALDSCLSKIDADKRSILLRRYQGTESVETIAKDVGQSPNSLSQSLRRMRSTLSHCIQTQIHPTKEYT